MADRCRSGSPRDRRATTRSCCRYWTTSPSRLAALACDHDDAPDCVIADKAYSHRSTRIALRSKGIRVVIPEKSDQQSHRKALGRHGGRPPRFDATAYRDRNVVERAFNRLKGWRGIATRYDKHARNYRAGIVVASIVLFWLC